MSDQIQKYQNLSNDEKAQVRVVRFKQIKQVQKSLTQKCVEIREHPRQKYVYKQNFNKFLILLQNVWIQIMPKFILPKNIRGLSAYVNKMNFPTILTGRLENSLKIVQQTNQMFVIMIYKQDKLQQSYCNLLVKLTNIYLIPLHYQQQEDIKFLDLTNTRDTIQNDPILCFFRYNIYDELVYFGDIQMNLSVMDFQHIFGGLVLQIEDYQYIEKKVESQYFNYLFLKNQYQEEQEKQNQLQQEQQNQHYQHQQHQNL